MPDTTKPAKTQGQTLIRAHRSFFVGLFVLSALLILSLFVVYTTSKSALFEDWRLLRVRYDSARGLKSGSAVSISGTQVGHVTTVALLDKGEADVQFKVRLKNARLVRKASKALLKQKNMVVGDWEIELTLGDPASALAQDNDYLEAGLPLQTDRIIAQAESVITNVEHIVKEIASGRGLVGQLIAGDSMVRAVNGILVDVRRLVRHVDNTVQKTDTTIDAYTKLGESGIALADSVQAMLAGLRPMMDNIRKLTEAANTASADVQPVLKLVEKDLQEVEVILKGLQHHWLLKRSIKKSQKADSAP